jgi:hypothetical protein
VFGGTRTVAAPAVHFQRVILVLSILFFVFFVCGVDRQPYGSDRCSVLVLTGVFKFLLLSTCPLDLIAGCFSKGQQEKRTAFRSHLMEPYLKVMFAEAETGPRIPCAAANNRRVRESVRP